MATGARIRLECRAEYQFAARRIAAALTAASGGGARKPENRNTRNAGQRGGERRGCAARRWSKITQLGADSPGDIDHRGRSGAALLLYGDRGRCHRPADRTLTDGPVPLSARESRLPPPFSPDIAPDNRQCPRKHCDCLRGPRHRPAKWCSSASFRGWSPVRPKCPQPRIRHRTRDSLNPKQRGDHHGYACHREQPASPQATAGSP
jgi:hypothetical protein